ncbi:hypothetical protein [Chromobacterium sphagni]|uniref:Sulfatase N-terminal domain-containing protein n=1 Tax=Chromobacterium sphagni TaxID=1903179 RepID=A0ABX3CBT6_9NEIS|nr:hypothetical protein [Chromobacterium sphagni]OHX19751.1 hypothetical protein BI344_16930 [Chromobacterium sphagni]
MSRLFAILLQALAIALGLSGFWLPAWHASAQYHGGYSAAATAAYLLPPLLAVALIAAAASILGERGERLLRALLLLTALYLLYKTGRSLLPALPALPIFGKLAAIPLLCAASWMTAARLSPGLCLRLASCVLLGAAFYAVTPYAFLALNQAGRYPVFSLQSPYAQAANSRNTLVILFDETGPQFIAPLLQTAAGRKLRWADATVPAAGADTVNAIPAMLTGQRFDDVVPCGSRWLCSPTRSLSFDQLYAGRPDLDIVGFWHPYCAIRGLRYCRRITGVFYAPLARTFLCSPPYASMLLNCRPPVGSRDQALQQLLAAAFAAPFWREGGMLYLHLPLPHPSMESEENLQAHYLKSVGQASQVLGLLLDRMRARFGNDFSVVLTSDHPLRTEGWCGPGREYQGPGCHTGLPVNKKRVPFIVISPSLPPLPRMPLTNVGVFHGNGPPRAQGAAASSRSGPAAPMA